MNRAITDKRLSDRAYRVYNVLATMWSEEKSVRKIAVLFGIGVGTAHRAIRELVDLGYLRVRTAGRGKRAIYEVKK